MARIGRRKFLKEAGMAGAAAAAAGMAGALGAAAAPAPAMPTIHLGGLRVSRLILGSNPFFGFAHGNPQADGKAMKAYYTKERIMATMDQAAEHGITAVWTPPYPHWIELWKEYQDRGGKLRIWIGQPDSKEMVGHLKACIENGAKAVAIQGCQIDARIGKGEFDVVRGWLETIKGAGLPAGMATHQPHTHLLAEEKGLPTDFYHQCMGKPEDYSTEVREEIFANLAKIAKPIVAYKVLGAGRILPKDAIPYMLKHLKPKDGLCVGVCPDKDPNQIAENVALVCALKVAALPHTVKRQAAPLAASPCAGEAGGA